MKTVEITEATQPFADYLHGVRTEPLVITDQGTPTAMILPLANVDLESVALGTNPDFIALIERSRARASKVNGRRPRCAAGSSMCPDITPARLRFRFEHFPATRDGQLCQADWSASRCVGGFLGLFPASAACPPFPPPMLIQRNPA